MAPPPFTSVLPAHHLSLCPLLQETFSKGPKKPVVCPVCSNAIEDVLLVRRKVMKLYFLMASAKSGFIGSVPACQRLLSWLPLHHQIHSTVHAVNWLMWRENFEPLSLEVAGLKDVISFFDKSSSQANSQGESIQSSNHTNHNSSFKDMKPLGTSERKFNLIFHGVLESPLGTSFNERLEKGYDVILSSMIFLITFYLHQSYETVYTSVNFKVPTSPLDPSLSNLTVLG